MRPVRTRNDLIELALPVVTPACRKAIMSGLGELSILGGFTLADDLQGWIIKVRSALKQEWLIAVSVDEVNRKYRVAYLDEVPWDRCNWRYLNAKDTYV